MPSLAAALAQFFDIDASVVTLVGPRRGSISNVEAADARGPGKKRERMRRAAGRRVSVGATVPLIENRKVRFSSLSFPIRMRKLGATCGLKMGSWRWTHEGGGGGGGRRGGGGLHAVEDACVSTLATPTAGVADSKLSRDGISRSHLASLFFPISPGFSLRPHWRCCMADLPRRARCHARGAGRSPLLLRSLLSLVAIVPHLDAP